MQQITIAGGERSNFKDLHSSLSGIIAFVNRHNQNSGHLALKLTPGELTTGAPLLTRNIEQNFSLDDAKLRPTLPAYNGMRQILMGVEYRYTTDNDVFVYIEKEIGEESNFITG